MSILFVFLIIDLSNSSANYWFDKVSLLTAPLETYLSVRKAELLSKQLQTTEAKPLQYFQHILNF